MVSIRVQPGEPGKTAKVTTQYRAMLHARTLRLRQPGEVLPPVAELAGEGRAAALGSSRILDFKAKDFQEWLDSNSLRRRKDESQIDFARRAFLYLKGHFKYDFDPAEDRTASELCRRAARTVAVCRPSSSA